MDQPVARHRTAKVLWGLLIGLVILGYGTYLILPSVSAITVTYWWFGSLHLSQVFTTRLSAQLFLGLMGFLVTLALSSWVLYSLRRTISASYGRWLSYLAVLVISLLAGYAFSQEYLTFLLLQNRFLFFLLQFR